MSAPTNVNAKVEKKFELVEERGIKIKNEIGNTPTERSRMHNPKMAVCREMTLVTLIAAVKDSEVKLCCVEGLATSGLASLQWKKALNGKIHVTAASVDCYEIVKENCTDNDIHPTPFPLDFTRTPGVTLPDQTKEEIHVCQARANVLLHMEAFDFIYLDPHKSCSSYIDSVFVNLRHLGILCLIVPDISVFARSQQVVDRMYSSAVIKTDYIKELAARVIIGRLARSAFQCNKGIEVLYTQSVDDFLLLCVKVHRGPHVADAANQNLRSLLHCRMCEERVILPKQKAPIENPYSLLPCTCQSEKIGKTAVVLGPVWAGPIFNPDFLVRMKANCEHLNINKKTMNLLNSMLEEVGHSITAEEDNSQCQGEDNIENSEQVSQTENIPNNNKDQMDMDNQNSNSTESESKGIKRAIDNVDTVPAKRAKRVDLKNKHETDLWSHPCVPFYYHTHRWKIDAAKRLPKLSELIQLLKSDGYLASRTHFDSKCVRTNATLKQIEQTLKSHCHVKH